MRRLNTSDVFAFARIVKASGMREEMKTIIKNIASSSERDIEDIGLESVLVILEALADKKSETAIYEMLAGPFEKTPEEVSAMGLTEMVDNLKILAKENDIKSFFTYVSGIVGKKS